jgi:hypothetical protein
LHSRCAGLFIQHETLSESLVRIRFAALGSIPNPFDLGIENQISHDFSFPQQKILFFHFSYNLTSQE